MKNNAHYIQFGHDLQSLIEYYGFTQARFAQKIGVSRTELNYVLNGKKPPGLKLIRGILKRKFFPEEIKKQMLEEYLLIVLRDLDSNIDLNYSVIIHNPYVPESVDRLKKLI